MKRLLLAAALASGCHCATPEVIREVRARSYDCVTACGLKMQGETSGECAALQEAEGRILLAYKHHVPYFHVQGACTTLLGWTVLRHDPGDLGGCTDNAWMETPGMCVGGMTKPPARTVEVTGTLEGGSLAHELGHVILGLGHCGWDKRGVFAAIKELTGSDDDTKPECGEDAAP